MCWERTAHESHFKIIGTKLADIIKGRMGIIFQKITENNCFFFFFILNKENDLKIKYLPN